MGIEISMLGREEEGHRGALKVEQYIYCIEWRGREELQFSNYGISGKII